MSSSSGRRNGTTDSKKCKVLAGIGVVGSSNVCLDLLFFFRFESKIVGKGGASWLGQGWGEGGGGCDVCGLGGWLSEGLPADELATREGRGRRGESEREREREKIG